MMQWRWTRISDHRESTFGGEPVDGRLEAGHHLLGHDLVVAVDDNRVQCLNDDLGRRRDVTGQIAMLVPHGRASEMGTLLSRQQGFCRTCRTNVPDGTVDHRDTLLTDPERDRGMMLICISRAADDSHLTLDL